MSRLAVLALSAFMAVGLSASAHTPSQPRIKMLESQYRLLKETGTVTGHAAAGGGIPADVEFLNREAGSFLNGLKNGDASK